MSSHAASASSEVASATEATASPALLTSSSSSSSSFKVASFNILSADYAHASTFFYLPPEQLHFSWRQPRILDVLRREQADVECLQEVDYDAVEGGMFDSPDDDTYGTLFLRRPSHKRDGLLIRFKQDTFELLEVPRVDSLDASTVGKQAAERKKESLSYRIHTRSLRQSTLQARVKKNRSRTTNLEEIAKGRKEKENLATALLTANPTAQNLVKRQTHILNRCDVLEHRIQAIMNQLHPKCPARAMVAKQLTAEDVNSNGSSGSSSSSSDSDSESDESSPRKSVSPSIKSTSASPSPPVVSPPFFHAVHFNDLSYLTRSKKNASSGLFARMKRENIGLIVLLRHRHTDELVLVANTHLFWNPEFDDVKVAQTTYLLQHITELRRLLSQQHPGRTIHVVLAGDLNSTPQSRVLQLIQTGRVEIVEKKEGEGQTKEQPVAASADAPTSALAAPAASLDPASSADGRPSNTRIKLLLSPTLLKITKWLRAIGVDTVCQSSGGVTMPNGTVSSSASSGANPASFEDENSSEAVEAFFALARRENRVIVTQKKSLINRRGIPAYFHLPSTLRDPLDIFHAITQHFGFAWDEESFYSICTTCGERVRRLAWEEYHSLPFLPEAYRSGMNDDGKPLLLTECTGRPCGRVRWWSSEKQLETRKKLFQVRLGMDVEMEEDGHQEEEDEMENGGEEENVSTTTGDSLFKKPSEKPTSKADSPPPVRSAPLSDTELAFARAARKAAKQSLKSSRALASAQRKAENSGRLDGVEKLASGAMFRGEDGEYLFDLKTRATITAESMGAAGHRDPTEAGIEPACESPFQQLPAPEAKAEAGTTQQTGVVAPPSQRSGFSSSSDTASLWWTAEKKDKMVLVEQRIIHETRRMIRARKKARESEAKEDAATGVQVSSYTPFLASPSPPSFSSSTLVSPAPSSFAAHLSHYWKSIVDQERTPEGEDYLSHSLPLSSAYSSPSDVSFTNCTPKFLDVIDWIFASSGLRKRDTRKLMTKAQLVEKDIIGYPTATWPSDHEMLTCTYEFAPR
jgi:mRNA deadenylase 3'-5' endonuclease subunit Ccr4/uncharacterized protein with PIN domain